MLEGFLAELLRQAKDLHCGHAAPPMEPSRLVVPANPANPPDARDFVSRMWGALPQPPQLLVAGAPPLFHNLVEAVSKGLPTTSLEELLRPLMMALLGWPF